MSNKIITSIKTNKSARYLSFYEVKAYQRRELKEIFTAKQANQANTRLHNNAISLSESGSSLDSIDTATITFEPIVNVPALGAFLLIFTLYSFLVTKQNAIKDAAEKRKQALINVRQTKSNQLAGKDIVAMSDGDDGIDDSIEVQRALAAYKEAILNEESVRTIAPGIRIRAPDGISEEDRLAAKQFVGIDFQQTDEKQEPQLKLLFEKRDDKIGFSNTAVVIMGLLVTALLGVQVLILNLENQTSSSLGGL